jgi:hypothetical protein
MASPSKGKSTPRLRRSQPEASSSYEYDQVQEDEHHAEIYQSPVSSTVLCSMALGGGLTHGGERRAVEVKSKSSSRVRPGALSS